MRTIYSFFGDVMHDGPSDVVERLSPWIIALLGSGMLAVMTYAWWTG
jgi:hypothetical protein